MRSIALLLLLSGIPVLLWGQAGTYSDPVFTAPMPPSPQASGLIRYDRPTVNMHTGTPDISIPLYEINTGQLQVPIVLRYDASGIRVSQDANSTGLGWTLEAEGVITKTVSGFSDNGTWGNPSMNWDPQALDNIYQDQLDMLVSLSASAVDGCPDVYSYHFGNYSGKFIINRQNEIVMMPQNDLKVDVAINGQDWQWTVTTENGIQYIFTEKERTNLKNTGSTSHQSTSWYLTQIKTPNNTDLVTFQYDPTLYDCSGGKNYSMSVFEDWNPSVYWDAIDLTYYKGNVIEEDHYYPFGLTLSSESTDPTLMNNHKLTTKELQKQYGLNWYDFGARMYDEQIGRWNGIDPKASKGSQFSPYCFSFNNPLRFIDADGAWPHSVHIRSFAPFKTFGGGFSGDNRGYSTSLSPSEGGNATSKVQHAFTVDPSAKTFDAGKVWSDESSHPILGTGNATPNDKADIKNFTSSTDKNGNSTVSFTADMSGANPLVPGSPDIDVHTKFTLTENQSAGTLNVNAVQTGDAFPSAETLIGDTKGNQLFIGVSPAIGNPYTSLPGDGDKKMMSANFTITMDAKGVFTGVLVGSGKDAKTYSVADWNKMMQAQPTTK